MDWYDDDRSTMGLCYGYLNGKENEHYITNYGFLMWVYFHFFLNIWDSNFEICLFKSGFDFHFFLI